MNNPWTGQPQEEDDPNLMDFFRDLLSEEAKEEEVEKRCLECFKPLVDGKPTCACEGTSPVHALEELHLFFNITDPETTPEQKSATMRRKIFRASPDELRRILFLLRYMAWQGLESLNNAVMQGVILRGLGAHEEDQDD